MTDEKAVWEQRISENRDPLTGNPRQTCSWHITAGPWEPHPVWGSRPGPPHCAGCGRAVALTDAGDWVYADC